MGILIHLHYFSYNERGNPNELNQFCETISVYHRENIKSGFSFTTPFIISSRINEDLIQRLQQDNHPILLEGIHCTGILPRLDRRNRKIVVRMHNEESVYYKEMARAEHGLLKKIFFYNESRLLKKYSHHLPDDCLYACISDNDVRLLKQNYKLHNVEFLPAFAAWRTTPPMRPASRTHRIAGHGRRVPSRSSGRKTAEQNSWAGPEAEAEVAAQHRRRHRHRWHPPPSGPK